MKVIMIILGILLIILGVIWFFQGINVLPGSFMTGHIIWSVYGAIAVLIGIFLLARGTRKGRRPAAPAPPTAPVPPPPGGNAP